MRMNYKMIEHNFKHAMTISFIALTNFKTNYKNCLDVSRGASKPHGSVCTAGGAASAAMYQLVFFSPRNWLYPLLSKKVTKGTTILPSHPWSGEVKTFVGGAYV